MNVLHRVLEEHDFSSNEDAERHVHECEAISSTTRSLLTNSRTMVKVFLRLRPSSTRTVIDQDDDLYVVLNRTTLLTRNSRPHIENKKSKLPKATERAPKKFTFSKIFTSNTSQTDFFNHCMRRQIMDFLLGESSTIMTYGTSNSGKTYTLYGTSTSPGVIPRSIELIFSAINCTLVPWYKCTHGHKVTSLDELARLQEAQIKTSLLNPKTIDRDQCAEARMSLENSISRQTESENREDYTTEVMSSLWISVAEIYNENVYDLLATDEQERSTPLKLTTDQDGTTHVKGLKSVYVTTGLEACQVLVSAQSRMSVACTMLNPRSSRSHTILALKLLKYRKEDALDEVQVSTLTFCDLAGSGGSRKASDVGARLTEARSINNSLLVLGRCLKAVCDGRSAKRAAEHVVGPFRESKLTRIFQGALSARESVSFVVNVDPATEFYAETQSVLNFAAVARNITVESSRELKGSFPSEMSLQSPKMSSTWDAVTLPSLGQTPERSSSIDPSEYRMLRERNERLVKELEALKSPTSNGGRPTALDRTFIKTKSSDVEHEDYKNLQEENKRLKEKLESNEKNALNRELQIREELVNQYSDVINELEASWRKRTQEIEDEGQDLLKWSVNQIESYYKDRIDSIVHNRKRKRTDSGDYEDRTLYKELEAENAQITSKAVALKKMVEKLKHENAIMSTERNKYSFQLAVVKEELKEFQELARNYVSEEMPQVDDKRNATSVRLADKLRSVIDDYIKYNESLEGHLYEEQKSCRIISSTASKTEQELSNARKMLEKISATAGGLEQQLFEKTNYIHVLEFQLQAHEHQISEMEKDSGSVEKNAVAYERISEEEPQKFSDSLCGYYQRYSLCNYDKSKPDLDKEIHTPNEKHFSVVNDECFSIDDVLDTALESQAHIDVKMQYDFTRDRKDISKKTSLSTSDGDRRSYLDSTVSADHSTFRSSESSIKEDSGIGIGCSCRSRWSASVSENITILETKEEGTQTCFLLEEKGRATQLEYEELKMEYTDLRTKCLQETLRAADLSEELENVKSITCTLKQVSDDNERKVFEYQNVLSSREEVLEQLRGENKKLTMKYNEFVESRRGRDEEYEEQSKCLQDYVEKCDELKHKVTALQGELERSNLKCGNEHLQKIEILETELLTKTLQLHEIDAKIVEMQRDLLRVHELYEKVIEFESILEKCQRERNDFRKRLHERSELQASLEKELQTLCRRIQEKDDQVARLRSETGSIMHMNVANSEKSKDLSKEIVQLNQTVHAMQKDLLRSEELRANIEKSSKFEIRCLKSQLAAFEKSDASFKCIGESNEGRQEEVDRLKSALCEKEREMSLFKKNRDATIKNYEALVKQLQTENENRKDRLLKLEKIFLPSWKECPSLAAGKRAISMVSDSFARFSQIQGLAKSKAGNWKSTALCKEPDDDESVSLIPTSSSLKECTSQVFDASTSSADFTVPCKAGHTNDDNSCDDQDASQIESSAELDESNGDEQSDISVRSEASCTCDISLRNVERSRKMSGWMKVRRINAKTELLVRSDERRNFNFGESVSEESECDSAADEKRQALTSNAAGCK